MGRNHNILIVDDDELVCRALERQLRGEGRHVATASSAQEALMKLACFDFSLVVSDHLMPETTGLELLKVVRRRFPSVVRIMLTGHADLDTAIDAINRGEIYRFLVKPWDFAAMQGTVSLALEKHDLDDEADRLRRDDHRRVDMAEELERRFPGITRVRSEGGAVILA